MLWNSDSQIDMRCGKKRTQPAYLNNSINTKPQNTEEEKKSSKAQTFKIFR